MGQYISNVDYLITMQLTFMTVCQILQHENTNNFWENVQFEVI